MDGYVSKPINTQKLLNEIVHVGLASIYNDERTAAVPAQSAS